MFSSEVVTKTSLTLWYFANRAVDEVSKERVIQMRMQMCFLKSMTKFYQILDTLQMQQDDYIGDRIFFAKYKGLMPEEEGEKVEASNKMERVLVLVFFLAFPNY